MSPPSAIDVDVQAIDDTTAVTIPNPLTLESVATRRAATGKLIAGVAAVANVDSFKGEKQHLHKPRAKRWDHRLNAESTSRKGNSLKAAAKYLKKPGIISLGGGLPSAEYFPFDELSIKVPEVGHFSEKETREQGPVLTAGKSDLADDKSLFDITTAFNYGQGTGSAQLLRYLVEHTEIVHDPPYQDWYCNMTIGSTSGLDVALRMFVERGDVVLTEDYTFATAVETAAPMGVRMVGVGLDDEGLLPESLDDILSNWDEAARGARKPFLLYTVPTGQNPTGATQSEQRRRDVYKVAQKHDLYILEDEPYYFLQMQPYTGSNAPDVPPPKTHADFLKSLVPSFLSMDVDGRVMRLDSFSKVVAPGSRVGWITASQQIVDRFVKHIDVSTQGPSGISQLVLFKLLEEHWGHAGFLDWLVHIRMEYTQRRDVMLSACEKYLPREVISWKPPMAGMFHWLQIEYEKHPDHQTMSVAELEEKIFQTIVDHGALVMKGSWFYADSQAKHDTMFFRTTYAAAPFDKINEAIKRLGDAVREEFKLESQ
ncbi:putative aromatic aminotransferase Aro8 [Aureobasidium pullulans]|uniref:aromatic-amino-acid transaminase n=1 Tax=Aureobasidium pullulans TaxID=5580 RepID=A0A4S9U5C2_AURPU|nr:putative aromatic aminotransferase Aro8 [Aureobasidium pullulans]